MAKSLKPPERITTTEWAKRHRRLSPKAAAQPGVYDPSITPWVVGMHQALDDPKVTKIVAMKSAQVAWTDGVLLNYIGKRIDCDPAPIIVMFAKDEAAIQFNDEKFMPMVEVSPRLASKIPVQKKRDRDNRQQYKGFVGGFLKFVGSNSPASVKSTPAPIVAVEEPDDCNENVRDQGDTITLLEERTKTFARRKVIFGGTPTVEGISRVEATYRQSDQRKFFVPCNECGESHVLAWENVQWIKDEEQKHDVYGQSKPETAMYFCPHCGTGWDDRQKKINVAQGEWRATAAFYGVAGFYINELYSPFPGSQLQKLVEKYLVAQQALARGDDTKMRSFRNNTEGLPYAYKSELPAPDVLAARAEDYEEFTVPYGGLLLTMGVDVQHDRLAVIIRAWGRGEESWLVFWGELYGNPMLRSDPVWDDLDALRERDYIHASGNDMKIQVCCVDSGDGQTADAVYAYVRDNRTNTLATKGASSAEAEIYSKPRESVDVDRKHKAAKYGVKPYLVGVTRGKDLLLGADAKGGRVKLEGNGPGVMHFYKSVRADYWDQLLSEIKVPSRLNQYKRVWQKAAGKRNEALDAEILALHGARHCRVHLTKDSGWSALESRYPAPTGQARKAQADEDQAPAPQVAPPITRFVSNIRRGRNFAHWNRG